MDPCIIAWLGAVGGSAVGVLGGVHGTYFSIKNTAGPQERAFVIRAAVICWVLVIAFVAGMWFIPFPQRFWLWLPYAILLPIGVFIGNRRQSQIRREETDQRA